MGHTITASGPTQTRLRAHKNQTRLGLVPFKPVQRDAQEELDRDNEAVETGQVCVNLHECHDQQGSQAEVRARPPG